MRTGDQGEAAGRAPILLRRGALSFVLAVLVGAVAASSAGAAIKIYETSGDANYLGKIKRGECGVRGKGNDRFFKAKGRTVEGGYRLKVIIDSWRGYGKDYDFRYGTSDPGEFHLRGIDGPFSNLNAPPGTRGLAAGGVHPTRRRMSVGFLPSSNPDFTEGVVLAGAMRCK